MLALLAVTLATLQQADTTFTVEPGARLQLSTTHGDIQVGTWDRNQVRVRATLAPGMRLAVDNRGAQVGIRATGRGAPQADYVLTIPASMEVALSSVQGDIRVEGSRARVAAETVNGDVTVTGGTGFVSARSVEGDVVVTGASGRVEAASVNSDVVVLDCAADISAETVNGEVSLRGARSRSVEASTVNGDITYAGTVDADGRYRLATHSGDVIMGIPGGTGATVQVSTYQGDFESDFPVTVSGTGGKRFTFTIGGGGARIDLESFMGTIRLRRDATLRDRPRE